MKLAHKVEIQPLRRSSRLTLSVPVVVWGMKPTVGTFFEETQTVSVAEHGASLILSSAVKPDQRMVIFNKQTQEELGCRVAHVTKNADGKTTVGITFEAEPKSNFWHVFFPPPTQR
jgi:hypothetical protein